MFGNLFKGFHRGPEVNQSISKGDPRATRLESLGITLDQAKMRYNELLGELAPFNVRIVDKTIAPFQQEVYDQKMKELNELREIIEAEESVENAA